MGRTGGSVRPRPGEGPGINAPRPGQHRCLCNHEDGQLRLVSHSDRYQKLGQPALEPAVELDHRVFKFRCSMRVLHMSKGSHEVVTSI